jgi:hypothetical protein
MRMGNDLDFMHYSGYSLRDALWRSQANRSPSDTPPCRSSFYIHAEPTAK